MKRFLNEKKNFNYKKLFSKFILFGFINTLLSKLFLILLIRFLTVGMSTLISTVFHSVLAYFFSKNKIFKRYGSPYRFFSLTTFSWFLEWLLIYFFIAIGLNREISVVFSIPIMATFSFLIQSKYIFID